jgi:K+-transporting ATPase A subunit
MQLTIHYGSFPKKSCYVELLFVLLRLQTIGFLSLVDLKPQRNNLMFQSMSVFVVNQN